MKDGCSKLSNEKRLQRTSQSSSDSAINDNGEGENQYKNPPTGEVHDQQS
jgi:hypothetical protein